MVLSITVKPRLFIYLRRRRSFNFTSGAAQRAAGQRAKHITLLDTLGPFKCVYMVGSRDTKGHRPTVV